MPGHINGPIVTIVLVHAAQIERGVDKLVDKSFAESRLTKFTLSLHRPAACGRICEPVALTRFFESHPPHPADANADSREPAPHHEVDRGQKYAVRQEANGA